MINKRDSRSCVFIVRETRLKHSRESLIFLNIHQNNFNLLRNLNMLQEETENEDKFYCELIATSISDIIRFSLDEEFRNSSFELLGVTSTKETEREICKRLMSIIKNQKMSRPVKTSRKRKNKLTYGKDKENLEEKKDTSDAKNPDEPSSVMVDNDRHSIDSEELPQNFFYKNWLQISAQHHINAVKRRKLNFFSQPLFSQECLSDIESSKCNKYLSHSQPTFTVSDYSSPFNETINTSSQLANDGATFCQKKFKLFFENNSQKYLRMNSKSYRHHRF